MISTKFSNISTMILHRIEPINWGPFYGPKHVLDVEQDVTVITGANDAGKSSLLRLIDAAYRDNGNVLQSDYNAHYELSEQSQGWRSDLDFGCKLTFELTDSMSRYVAGSGDIQDRMHAGSKIVVTRSLCPDMKNDKIEVFRGDVLEELNDGRVVSMPHIIGLPTDSRVRNEVSALDGHINHAERLLLQKIFGVKDLESVVKKVRMSRPNFVQELKKAEMRLNDAVEKMFPKTLQLEFSLQPVDNGTIAFHPHDNEYGIGPLGSRGTGIQVLLSLLASLLEVEIINNQILIWVDEPETSLHADSQHMLRNMLEEIARSDNIQVVYATHSPAMINNMRPRSVRLLSRLQRGDYVTTVINNCPVGNNYDQVRSSLGISPCDSLQFAPLTIVVEGPTDIIAVSALFQKLFEWGIPEFRDVPRIMSMIHCVSSVGDTIIKMAKFCATQSTRVIVLFDGDKKISQRNKEDLKALNIEYVQISQGREIEEILDADIYFRAISSVLLEDGFNLRTPPDYENFTEWLTSKATDNTKRKAYSKKIDDWLFELVPDFKYRKPRVYRTAVNLLTSQNQVDIAVLEELIEKILNALPSTH